MLSVRKAHIEDCLDIYRIRNEEGIRKFSFDSSVIPYETHILWFDKILLDDQKRLYVVTEGEKVQGVVRFDLTSMTTAEVSIYVSSLSAGMGIGRYALLESEKLFKNEIVTCSKIVAKVLIDNQKSINFFKGCDYVPYSLELVKKV